MFEKKQWTAILDNQDFIWIETYSGYTLTASDPLGKQYLLELTVENIDLGAALFDALAHSRFIIPEIFVKQNPTAWRNPEAIIVPENIFEREYLTQRYNEWISQISKQFGYKSKRAMFKNMRSVDATKFDGNITLSPSNHERLEGWGGDGISEKDNVVLPENSSPDKVGEGIRLALSRCI